MKKDRRDSFKRTIWLRRLLPRREHENIQKDAGSFEEMRRLHRQRIHTWASRWS